MGFMTTVKHVKNWSCVVYLLWTWQVGCIQCMISVIHTQIYSNGVSEVSIQTIRDVLDRETCRWIFRKYTFEDTKIWSLETQMFQVIISFLSFIFSNILCVSIEYLYMVVHVSNLLGPVCKTLKDIKNFSLIGYLTQSVIVKSLIFLKCMLSR